MLRRDLLATAASLPLIPLAGCQASKESSTTDPMEKTDYKLTQLSIWNRDTAAHSIDLIVLRNGEVVYWRTVDLESESGWSADAARFDLPNASGEPAAWEIVARFSNRTDGEVFTSTEMVGEDGCIRPIITVHEDGEMGFAENLSENGCQ